ncbi:MAG: cytidine deaminase [Nitrospiraceae bacterium]|nr:cytidine deaminase [Nitrospiraceae bacterium]
MHDRPTWDEYFMALALAASSRSHDPDTKHGALIVDADNRVLGLGYNGYPRHGGEGEAAYPDTRPEKYRYIIHAEENAIVNCGHRPEGGTMYVTGFPCSGCFKLLIQSGIKRLVFGRVMSMSVMRLRWRLSSLWRTYMISNSEVSLLQQQQKAETA